MKRFGIIVFVLLIAISIPCSALCERYVSSNTARDIIIARAIADNHGLDYDDIEIIPVIENSQPQNANASLSTAKAIQYYTKLEDGTMEVTTILPFKSLPNGTLINSFVCSSIESVSSPMNQTLRYSDMDLELKGTYKQFQSAILNTFHAYHMYKGSFRWSKTNATTTTSSVTYMKLHACVAGKLYTNPSDGSEPRLINSNFSREKTVTKNNPTISTWHSTSNVMSSSDGIVYCNDLNDHGGWVFVEFNYIDANGTSRSGDFSTWCFRK